MSSKLMDEMRDVMRRRHYSIHTERTYCDWVKRYVRFHKMQSREELRDGEKKIEAFLTHLARDRNVAASTQNQAMNALVFLYKHVLQESPGENINAERAATRLRVPVVLTRDETARVLALMSGVHRLIAQLLYGCGLRITECLRLRVQDLDFEMKALTVRSGKGNKDRVTTFPGKLVEPLREHLVKVKLLHERDLEGGYGEVYLPHALARKYPGPARTGGGSMSSPPSTGPLTLLAGRCAGITSTRAPSTRRSPRPYGRQGSTNASAPTRSGTASRPICYSAGPTSARFNHCWGTRTFPLP